MQPQHRLIKFPQLTSPVLVPRKELQLVGISFMLIASRYEELLAPEVIFFLYGLLNVVGQVHSVGSSSP
ncbi:hypothetical protein P8452_64334 [Trifolium repens]|nr:hypothetical protein P8452_64334 [Trifolium repens]